MQNTALNGNFHFEFEIKSQCFPLFKLIIKVYSCWQEKQCREGKSRVIFFSNVRLIACGQVCWGEGGSICRRGHTIILTDSPRKSNGKEILANYNKTRINIDFLIGSVFVIFGGRVFQDSQHSNEYQLHSSSGRLIFIFV